MKQSIFKCNVFVILAVLFTAFLCSFSVYAVESDTTLYTIDTVNFRTGPSTDSEVITTLSRGAEVFIMEYDEWSAVMVNDATGYINSEFLGTAEEYEASKPPEVELLTWSDTKGIFTIGVDALVYDIRTGMEYYVRSFSNGRHADVEPVTKEDTAIMYATYGNRWAWDPRPVWVTINGRTIAASINGMPHGGGVNPSNGMNGQICIHFKGSTTHNGNRSFERDHQNAIDEAWYSYSR